MLLLSHDWFKCRNVQFDPFAVPGEGLGGTSVNIHDYFKRSNASKQS